MHPALSVALTMLCAKQQSLSRSNVVRKAKIAFTTHPPLSARKHSPSRLIRSASIARLIQRIPIHSPLRLIQSASIARLIQCSVRLRLIQTVSADHEMTARTNSLHDSSNPGARFVHDSSNVVREKGSPSRCLQRCPQGKHSH